MTWKVYAAMTGAGILATYFASAPPTFAPGAPAARPDAVAQVPTPPARDIQQQAARLQTRLHQDVEYREPSRDPFRFNARTAPAPRAERAVEPPPEPVTVAVTPAEPLVIRLSGVATNSVNGERRRTAILSTPQGIVEAREGDTVGPYRVVRVEDDAVELAAADGTTRRITLR
jgi:hypothetical protein